MIAALLARFAPYKLALEIIVFGAIAAFIVAAIHQFLEHERQIGRNEVQILWDKQKEADKLAADKLEKNWREQYDSAITQGARNAQALQTAANATVAASNSLRDTNAALRERLPNATAETARSYASTLSTILADCEGRYRAMGQAAQGHYDDTTTLEAAFPTK